MKKILLSALIGSWMLSACTNSTEVFPGEPIRTYFPLEVGKYITYQLDSTVFLPFGTSSVIRSYQVKYYTDGEINDNLGRRAFRIIRYIRNNDSAIWQPDASFLAIDDTTQAEFIDNNLRFIKIKLPIKESTTWRGNSYIDTYSINSTVRYLDGWDYIYDSIGMPCSIGNYNFANCIKVIQHDEILGDPSNPNVYSEINTGIEKYAAGIGMIYRKFYHSEYQPGGNGFFADGSYGVEYRIIDHN